MYRHSISLPEFDQTDASKASQSGEYIALLLKESNRKYEPKPLLDSWYAICQRTDDLWPNKLCHYVCDDNFLELTKWEQCNPDLISIRDCFGDTVLHLAVWNGRFQMTMFLLKFIDINIQGFCGRTPLHWAVWGVHYDIVVLLLDNGALLDVKDKESEETPLHYAAITGHTEIVQMLLDRSPSDNVKDIYGRTALHHATSRGHKYIIELLIKSGSNVNAQTKGGWTPLHYAINNRQIDIVMLLLKADVNVNIKDVDGVSAFQMAYDNNLDITNLLLDNVVNLEVTDDVSYSVVEKAMTLNVPDVLRCLIVRNGRGKERDEVKRDEELTVEYLKSRLDDCIGRQNRKMFVNFSTLLPSNFKNFSVILLIFLCITKEKKFEHLLLHPTVRIFLFWKWKQVAKYFYINLFLFLAICANIIIYQILFYCSEANNFTDVCYLSYSIIIFSVFILSIRETMQITIHFKGYINNIENYYELALIVYLIVLLCWYPDFKTRVQISAVGNILIAVTVTMVIGHHPWAISAVHLLKMVTFKFFKYFIVYLVIILSFSLSFYQLYAINKYKFNASVDNCTETQETNLLDYPELSILRTIAMFIGELNLTDFSSKKYSFVLIVMLLSFIVLVSIIILNLLNGLAISNVLGKTELKISHTKSQLEYLYNLSNIINLVINILEIPKFASSLTKKMPVTPLNHEVNNIFIVPSYIDCKTLFLKPDQVLVRSNRIHRDAYDRFKKKQSSIEMGSSKIASNCILRRSSEVMESKMNDIKDMVLEIKKKNEDLMENMTQMKLDHKEIKEILLKLLKE